MPGKNFIVRMADRLRSGKIGEANTDRDTARDYLSRQHTLAALTARLKSAIASDARYSTVHCSARPTDEAPERLQLRAGESIVTMRIAPGSEFFAVSGCGLGKRFSANPAHLQSDDVVLLSADENGTHPYGTEFGALDFLEDLVRTQSAT
ncbi:MAG TPA: hypothetical protein VKT51_07300 [Candidatus Eremiobacteraceae bacterium]|nr:hypothetical protein [Candidatus Eremiobacteraceae bacterium]